MKDVSKQVTEAHVCNQGVSLVYVFGFIKSTIIATFLCIADIMEEPGENYPIQGKYL